MSRANANTIKAVDIKFLLSFFITLCLNMCSNCQTTKARFFFVFRCICGMSFLGDVKIEPFPLNNNLKLLHFPQIFEKNA